MKKILLSFVFLLSCFGASAKASAENIILASWSKSNLNSIKPTAVQTGDPYWEAQGGTIPPGLSGTVNAIAVTGSDVYVGGSFSSMNGNTTAAYIAKWNGTSWEALGTGVNNTVNAITISGSDVYVGGSFTTAGGVSTPGIARWDGSTWNSVGGGITSSNIRAIAVSGSNVYVGGAFTDANGNTNADNIVLWDGASWNALGTGLSATVNTIVIGNTKVYVGGNFQNAGGDANADRIAYWDLDSVKWKSMSTGSASQVYSLAFQSDTSLYVGIANAPGIRKWNGTVFSTIGSTSLSSAVRTIVLNGSEIIVGGDFTLASPRLVRIAKWTGSAWQSVDSLSNTINAIASSSDGKLYIGGAFTNEHGMSNANYIVQWNGTRLIPIGTGLANTVRAIVASGTTVSVGGDFTDADTLTKADYAARWNGFTWSAMQSGFKGSVYSMSQTGTTIFAGGSFTQIGTGTKVNNVARWTGSTWGTMNVSGGTANTVGTNGSVNAVAAVTTTRAYVGGSFTKLGDSTIVNGIARWTNGVGWEALGSGVSGGNVYALALSGTKLYVGGDFTSAGGVANTSHIAVWDTATATWSALGSGISNNTVYSIVVNGSDVYVGGNFTDAGGVAAADHIAKWDGVSWSSVGTGTEINNTIRTMAFLGTDLYVGGDFTDAAGYSGGDYIAKWSGSAWSALGDGANNSVYAIIAAGSDLYAGGNFTSIDGSSASRFARYRVPDVTAPSTPTNLTASTGPNQLVLKWKKNSDVDFSKYRIYFGSTSNPTVQTDSSLSISDTSRTITGLTNGTTYYFRVSAVDIWGNQSSLSTQASGIPNDTVPPSTPSLISATGGNLTVNLTWSKNNDSDFKRYRIYRGTSPGATTQVDSVSIVGDTTKSVSAPIPGVTFYFRVRTLDSANNLSAYSGELSASSLDQTPPSAITGLSTTASDTTVILRWHQSTATDFGKYYIYMDTVALPATAVDSALTKADTARTFTHLTNGKTYYFRVTAADTFANVSAFSSVASATPFDQTSPSAPQNLAAVASNASVVLHWDANTENDLLRYRVFVGTSSGNQVQTDSTVHDSIVVNGLNSNTEYFFRIAAIDTGKNQSNYSNEVSATPFAANAAPTNPVLLAATAQNQSVVLTWQKNPDADILKYYVAAGLSSNPTALVDSTNGDTTVTLSGLTNEQAYYFRIIAVDSALQVSGYSNELSQSPYDNVAPATPVNFIASAGDQSAQLTWNNDNTEPIKIYRVFVNGTQADSLTDTTYTVTGLTNYTTYQVSIAAVDSNDNVSSNTSDIGVTPIDLTAPSIPNNLTAEASDASVHLVWSANTEGDLAWYRIYINDVQSDSTTDTSYTANALTNYTSYSFKIAAVDTSHNASALTSQVSVMPYDQTAPAIPQDLAATAGDGQVTLNWTANGEGDLARYRVYMDGTQIDSTTNNSYTKTGLTNYTSYGFSISAVDTGKNVSAQTTTENATPYDQTAPAVPQDLTATAGDGQVTLNWTANGESDFARYRVYMDGTQIDSTTNNSYTKTGLTNYTTYNFKLSAVDTSRNASALTSQVSVMPYDQTAPSEVTGLSVTRGDGALTLNWTANGESDFKAYRLFMGTSPNPTTQVDSVTTIATTSKEFGGLVNGTTYYYRMVAVDTSGNASDYSDEVSSSPYDQTAPSVPQNLTATAGDGQVTLNWTANSEGDLARYRVYMNGMQIDSTTNNSYTRTGLANYTSYGFSISAVDTGKNVSAQTTTENATPYDQTAPAVPQDLAATAGDGQVTLNWTANSEGDLARYRVYMDGTQIDSTTSNSYTKTGLTNYTTYNFKLSAIDTSRNASALTSQVSAMPYDQTAPSVPQNLTATAGDGQVTLNWTANGESDLARYRVYMDGTQIDSTTSNSYIKTGLTNYTSYSFKLSAVDTSRNASALTSQVSVMPYDQTAPAVPQDLAATAGDGQVTLNWTANGESDLARYRVYMDGTQIDSTTNNSYTKTGLTNYTTYSFKLSAVDTSRNASALTSQVSVMPYDQTAPAVPQDLTATAGDGQVTLNWTANGESDFARYRVYMDGTQIDSTTNNSYTRTGLTNYTMYNFKLSAVDTSRNASALTSQVSVMPYDQTAPSEVTGLSVTRGDGALTLNWTANGESDFKAYRLFMGTSPNPTTQVDSVTTIATTSKEFGGLVNGTTYYYRMVAVDTSGNASDYSDEVSSSPYDQTAPAVPQDLAATAGDGQVTLNWTANAESDLARYRVYMNGTQIDSTTNNSYTKNGLTNDVTYNFKIAAVDTGLNFSAFSTQVSGTPTDMTAPSKPTVLTAVAGNTSIVLTWRKNIESDVIRYRIYRGTTAAPTTQVDSTTSASDTTKTYGGLTNGTTYFFRVTAVDGHGNFSVYSDDISAKPLDAPGSLTVSLFQNKAAKKYAQITVVSSKALSAVPTVTAKLGINNTPVTMTAIASSNQQFRGGFVINSAGNYTLQTSAQTLNGRDTTVQRTFNAVIAKSGEAATLASTDGKASLKLNRATLAEEAVLLSEQSDDGVYTFSADAEANGSMILEIQFDAAQYADPSKLFIYRMEKETWSKQKTQVFTKTNTLKAQVESFGTYKIAYDGSFDGSNIVPTEFALLQNYPNPFNPSTTIRYDLREDETVSLKIYNMLGQEVRTLRKGFQMAGEYRVQWDGRNNAGQVVSSGVYIYRLETKSYRATKKMMFLK